MFRIYKGKKERENIWIKCITLIEHFEHIANILRELKIGNNNKFLISTQENSNLEIIKFRIPSYNRKISTFYSC